MTIQKNDFFFLLSVVILSGLAALALSNSDLNVQLYGVSGLLAIILVLAVIVKPNFGANVLVIAIFSNVSAQLTDHGYPAIISPLVIVVFCAIMIRNYYAGQLPADRSATANIEVCLVLYLVVIAASYQVASNKDRALTELINYAKDLAILYTILFSLREWKTWKQAIWLLIITTALLSLLGVYQIVTGTRTQEFFRFSTVEVQGVFANDNKSTARIGGPVHDPNLWAQVIVAVIPLVIFRLIHEKQVRWKILSLGILISLFIVLLDTYSRGGYLALIVVLILIFFVYEIKYINPLRAVVGIVFLVFIVSFLPSSYVDRLDSLFLLTSSPEKSSGVNHDSSLKQRSSVVETAFLMFTENPLLGVGAGNFRNNYQKYNQILGIETQYGEVEAHSLYMQILSETGLLGALAFLCIILSLLLGLSKAIKAIELAPEYKSYIPWIASLQIALIGYLIASAFLHNAYIRYFWVLVSLSMTAIQLAHEQLRDVDDLIPQRKSL